MRITISTESGEIYAIDFPSSLTVEDFKAYLEAETGIPVASQILIHNTKTLAEPKRTLDQAGLQDDDLVELRKVPQRAPAANSQNTQASQLEVQSEQLRLNLLSNPMALESTRHMYPDLVSAVNDPVRFREILLQTMQAMSQGSHERQLREEELRRLEADPDDPANQARIMEIIKQQQIDENLQLAADISPELFVPVSMLYIKLRIKGHDIYALVDSGAAHTIISSEVAERCGLSNLIDTRYITEARGVGKQTSKGRIHSAPVSIGDSNADIPCSFTVLDLNIDCLFGLDMLKRHKCNIDLSKNALVIGDIETKFLSDLEIEKHIKPMEK